MSDVRCEIEGLDDLEKLLTQLAPKEAKTALRRSERKAATLWQDEIERLAPKDSGFLSEHITIRSSAGAGDANSTGSLTVTVAPSRDVYPLADGRTKNRDAAQVALYNEFGTIHEAAHPFISVAYENKKDEVVTTFQQELGAAIDKLTPK